MSCVSVKIVDPMVVGRMLPHQLTDGGVYLDLDAKFQLRITKLLEALSEINKISIERALGISILRTPANDAALLPYILSSVVIERKIKVEVYVGHVRWRFSHLYVYGLSDGSYDCELRVLSEHWIAGASELKLNTLKLGVPFTISRQNVYNHLLLQEYQDNGIGVRFPLCHYGAWTGNPKSLSPLNFRPWFCLLHVLRAGACALGWEFRSTALETDWGRRQIAYLMGGDFTTNSSNLREREFRATHAPALLSVTSGLIMPINFEVEEYDYGGHYDNVSGKYSGAGVHKFHVEFGGVITVDGTIGDAIWYTIFLCYYSAALGQELIIETADFGADYSPIIDGKIFLDAEDIQVDSGDSVYVKLRVQVNGGVNVVVSGLELSGLFYNVPKQVVLQVGDTYNFNDLINSEHTYLDLLKGAAHLVSGKFHTDYVNRVIWLYPPYDCQSYNNDFVEGYFKSANTIDLDYILLDGTENVVTPDRIEKRYKLLKFKGEGDYEIKQLALAKNVNYLGRTVDFGTGKNEYEISENPFFAPTRNMVNYDVSLVLGLGVDIPHLYGSINTETPKADYDITPRIAYWAGLTEQQVFSNGAYRIPLIASFLQTSNDHDPQPLIPWAFQYTDAQSVPTQGVYREENTIYGTDGIGIPTPQSVSKNLYNFFIRRWLRESEYSFELNALLLLEINDIAKLDFRNQYTLTFLGRTTLVHLVEVKDFSTCDNTSTPVTLIPIRGNMCTVYPAGSEPDACSGNVPTLEITKLGDTYSFGMGGVNVSTITAVTYQYKYNGSDTWITATSLSSPTGAFVVRMVVQYVDCPAVTRQRLIDVCGNIPAIAFQYNYVDNCFVITPGGAVFSPVDTLVIEYSIDGGITWNAYAPCQATTAILIQVRATWTFSDGCLPVTIEESYNIPPLETNCSATNADATCDPDTGLITRTGVIQGEVALDIIEWREVGLTDWQIWDNATPITPCPFEYRRVIFFCGNVCPTYCGAIHLCACPPCAISVSLASVVQPDDTYDLTATVTGCTTPTFVWWYSDGVQPFAIIPAQTTATFNAAINGQYKVVVECVAGCDAEAVVSIQIQCSTPVGVPRNIIVCN